MADRLGTFLDLLLSELGESRSSYETAQEAHLSCSHAIRAFQARFGESPAAFRRRLFAACAEQHPLSASGSATPHGGKMDLLKHLLAFDEAFLRQVISQLRNVPARLVAQPFEASQPLSFDLPDHTLRELLDKLILNKEIWVAAIRDTVALPEDRSRTPAVWRAQAERRLLVATC